MSKAQNQAAITLLLTSLCIAGASQLARAEFGESSYVFPLDHEAIQYARTPINDPVTQLIKRIETGKVKLEYDEKTGYLPALLRELKVPASSQGFVFSKTSFQLTKINPRRPRAVYFGDDAYVGFCQDGDVLEISSVDPVVGGVFWTLDQLDRAQPRFTREERCLTCHASSRTAGVPGHLVRSVVCEPSGQPIGGTSTYVTDHRSPFRERWGGWYVTGTHGSQLHLGNLLIGPREDADRPNLKAGANVTDLSQRFDTSPYLTPHSDIVALMVLEHQTRMHNLITAVSYEARIALDYQQTMNKVLNQPPGTMLESTQRRFQSASEALLKYLLMVEEAPLDGPVKGTTAFAEEFSNKGPQDSKGRSLRQLDLRSRLFKYPCSYLIYSEAWDHMPPAMRDFVYRRLFDILTGKDSSPAFAKLTPQQRQDVLEILRETKKNLPAYWAKGASADSE
jgi:hypothetical protein